MKISIWLAALALLANDPALAQNAYITNNDNNSVSVIDTVRHQRL